MDLIFIPNYISFYYDTGYNSHYILQLIPWRVEIKQISFFSVLLFLGREGGVIVKDLTPGLRKKQLIVFLIKKHVLYNIIFFSEIKGL